MFRDYIPIALIVACLIIWMSGRPWDNPDSVAIAGDIVKVTVSGILGYMVRAVTTEKTGDKDPRLVSLEKQNKQLMEDLEVLKNQNGL